MTYSVGFYAAWIVAAVGVVAGVLAGASQTPWHPAWLTGDVAATAGIISGICVALAALLPQIGRSPGKREDSYVKAAVSGELPKDIAERHPLIRVDPAKPLDTI